MVFDTCQLVADPTKFVVGGLKNSIYILTKKYILNFNKIHNYNDQKNFLKYIKIYALMNRERRVKLREKK
jgi:hypothetical protein